ncbi:hypothetical protein D3C87_82050 [compost metagenome]
MNVESLKNEELITMMKEYEKDQTSHKDYIWEVWDEVTKRKLLPKYFEFRDENTEIYHLLPVTCSDDEFYEWANEDSSGENGFIESVETKYGVHDTDNCLTSEAEYFGFSSYEVEEKKQLKELLSKWKDKLVELGWAKNEDEWSQIELGK